LQLRDPLQRLPKLCRYVKLDHLGHDNLLALMSLCRKVLPADAQGGLDVLAALCQFDVERLAASWEVEATGVIDMAMRLGTLPTLT
jgi:hypothetical protein